MLQKLCIAIKESIKIKDKQRMTKISSYLVTTNTSQIVPVYGSALIGERLWNFLKV